jgi:nicotinamide-nucleotide amidase
MVIALAWDVALLHDAAGVLEQYRSQQLMVASAESCTGGLLAALLTEVAGCSDVFERGFVTYSNQAKQDQLDVAGSMIQAHGSVSECVAKAMAEGAVANSRADIAVSVTGIAGPGGGTPEKPIGLVFIGTHVRGLDSTVTRHQFLGDRHEIRTQTLYAALEAFRQGFVRYMES